MQPETPVRADETGPVDAERPPLTLLVRQLADDAQAFARAEAAFIKERAGEGWHHAVPGLAGIGIAVALLFGAFIALPLGLMLILGAYIGLAWAVPAVILGSIMIGLVLIRLGSARLKASLKLPEDR